MALYFADNANMLDRFAHTTAEGDKELIVVLVITGEAYDYGTKQIKNSECHL